MTKFNVGDSLEFIEKYGSYEVGDKVTVTGCKDDKLINFDGKYGTGCALESRFKLSDKPTKNQRIKALETEVAELKLIVHELRDRPQLTTVVNNIQEPSTINDVEDIIEFEGVKYRKVEREAREGDVVVFNKIPECSIARKSVIKGKPYKVHESDGIYKKYINDEMSDRLHVYGGGVLEGTPETVDVYELIVEDKSKIRGITIEIGKPKSPNEQRAQIIEDAKKFVEEQKQNVTGTVAKGFTCEGQRLTFRDVYSIPYKGMVAACDAEFIVNKEKRTVVALLKGRETEKLHAKGIAKCNPSDVFNEHIGKAIALGRALNIDVSRFEKAVQPNEFAKGQIIRTTHMALDDHEIIWIKGNNAYFMDDSREEFHYLCRAQEEGFKIINDTNAQYGGVE